ncbi:MAG: hypothetical protein IBX40_09920 [Methanosarcinales archaeon]|nr:hypothetical protein [Methanosarcinales archaeon]
MVGFIPTLFEFVPVGIITALFFLIVLYVKHVHKLNLRSVGSDICLGALFIQITMLALPLWATTSVSINVIGQSVAVILTLFTWIITNWLLKRRKPSRTFSTNFLNKLFNRSNKPINFREFFSFVLGIFALCISLMMVLNVIGFGLKDFMVLTTHLAFAAITSMIIGYAGHGIYRYLQNEQFTQQFSRFFREITADNVLITIQAGGIQIHDRDPVQPVVDIIRGSIMKGVLGPSLFGLKILKESCIEIITSSGMRQQNLNKVTLHFINNIYDINKLALRMDEDEVAIESVINLSEIGEIAVYNGLEKSVEDILSKLTENYDVIQIKKFDTMKLVIIDSISHIGSAAAAHGMESSASKASNMLGNVGISAVRTKHKTILNKIINVLYIIGEASGINSLESTLKQTAVKLRDMGTSLVQSDLIYEALQIITKLEKLGFVAASNKLELATEQVLWSIKDIGVSCGYQRNEQGIKVAVNAFANIGLESSRQKLHDALDQAIWSLKEVSRYPISEELESSTKNSAKSFASLATVEFDKVEKAIHDLKQYFGSDETDRFDKFETQYIMEREKNEAN